MKYQVCNILHFIHFILYVFKEFSITKGKLDCQFYQGNSGLEVIKLEVVLKLKIKRND